LKTPRDDKADFDTVLEIGAALSGVRASSSNRGVALKLDGELVACTAINPSAEPNSLMVCLDFKARDALIEKEPDTYYTTSHYLGYPCALVRLPKIGRPVLRNLLKKAVQFVGARNTMKARTKTATNTAKKTAKKASTGAGPAASRRL